MSFSNDENEGAMQDDLRESHKTSLAFSEHLFFWLTEASFVSVKYFI